MVREITLMEKTAKDLMRTFDGVATKEQSLNEVLSLMRTHNLHDIPIIEGGKVIGIVSYNKLIRKRKVPLTTSVKKIMHGSPTVTVDDSLPTIVNALLSADLMAVPVTRKDKFVGIVTRQDVISLIPDIRELKGLDVSNVMVRDPILVEEDDSLDVVRKKILEIEERSIPVVNEKGVLTGRADIMDIINLIEMKDSTKRVMAKDRTRAEPKVKFMMKGGMPSFAQAPDLRKVISLMKANDSAMVIFTKDGIPYGVVTDWDLLRHISEIAPKDTVHVEILGIHESNPSISEGIFGTVQKSLRKIERYCKPMSVRVHVGEHLKDGEVVRYTLGLKIMTDKGVFFTSAEGYELFSALDESLLHMGRQMERLNERFTKRTSTGTGKRSRKIQRG